MRWCHKLSRPRLRATTSPHVTELIREKRGRGTAMLGIFHDVKVRDAVADRVVAVEMFAAGDWTAA